MKCNKGKSQYATNDGMIIKGNPQISEKPKTTVQKGDDMRAKKGRG